jgi:hypothetical protein
MDRRTRRGALRCTLWDRLCIYSSPFSFARRAWPGGLSYGTMTIGARQKANFCAAGSSTLTWQV